MAGGVSKYYERGWVYDPDGDRFEDRVGRILSRGHNLRDTFREQAQQTAVRSRAFENEQMTKKTAEVNPEYYHQTSNGTDKAGGVDKRGMVWVTDKGEVIGPATQEHFAQLPPPPTPKEQLPISSQRFMASLTPEQRSKTLWKKINPACMEVNTHFPNSTLKDHYAYQPELVDKIDKTHNRRKTDFSDFANAKLKYDPAARK